MHLYKKILAKILEKEEINVIFPNLEMDVTEMVEMKCYEAPQRIKKIIEDDSLSDEQCFSHIGYL